MGQRTLTLISTIDERNNERKNYAYYNQWGIGRVQTNAIMGAYLSQFSPLCEHCNYPDYRKFHDFNLKPTESMRDDLNTIIAFAKTDQVKPTTLDPDQLAFDNLKDCQTVLRYEDNNNGAVAFVIRYYKDEDGKDQMAVKIGFLLGYEEVDEMDDAFSHFVPFEEWADKVGRDYVDQDYRTMFLSFIKHFEIEIL